MKTNSRNPLSWAAAILGLIVLTVALSGCGRARYYEAVSEAAVKDAKDIEAAALEDAPCLIGLGAWSRMPELRVRNAVFALCVPDSQNFGVVIGGQ